MKTQLKETTYRGSECVDFSNGTVQLLIPKGFGPRVLYAGFRGEKNLFARAGGEAKTPYGTWKIYGGHRLWTSPEDIKTTYYPDNDKIGIAFKGDTLTLSQNLGKLHLRKEMKLRFTDRNKVQVTHKISNRGKKKLSFSVWALSVMEKGGFAVIPQNTDKEDGRGFLPTQNLVLWSYSKFNDKRWKKSDKFVYVKQSGNGGAFKIGQRVPAGYAAYSVGKYLFVKRFKFIPGAPYPDFQSNLEIYSCGEFLEFETLSPLAEVAPGASLSHAETWEFYRNRRISFGSENPGI
jgi:hypothetical protein